jgi:hypothetical protein
MYIDVACSRSLDISNGLNFRIADPAISKNCRIRSPRIPEASLLDQAKTPGLLKWADRFCADGAVKGLMPETEKFVEFGKATMAKIRGAPPK